MPDGAELLQTALAHHQSGRLAEAEQAYRALLQVAQDDVEALRLLGGLYLQTGQFEAAARMLERASRLRAGDREILTNLGIALRGLGRIDEALGAYGAAARAHPDHAPSRYNYAAVLSQAGRVEEAITHFYQAVRLSPDYIDAIVDLGVALSQSGRGDEAQPWLQKARAGLEKRLAADPADVAAMNNMGNVLQQTGAWEQAAGYYRDALTLRPDYAAAAVNLATCLCGMRRLPEAVDMCRYAINLMPQSPDMRVNLGVYLQEMARHEEAVEAFDEALRLRSDSPYAKWNRGFSLLALGRYAEGWRLHDSGLGTLSMRGNCPYPERLWRGEDIKGKRLLIWCEQGMGDDLQFIRYAALCKARGCRLLVQCPQPLRRLFANDPSIDALVHKVDAGDFDFHAPLMSLPGIFGTVPATIPATVPYLAVSAATRARWAGQFTDAGGFKVGLVWAGNTRSGQMNAHLIDRRRSMSLEMLRPLFDVEDVRFYNLQMGDKAAQIDQCGLRGRFVDLMGEVRDFEDTGAIIEHLDLVISVDTSVVHLAGGMGRPVWVLSRFDACWRWLQNRPDSPWYPTARVFGQKTPGDWATVVGQVRQALIDAVAHQRG